MSHYQNRRFCPVFKIGGFVSHPCSQIIIEAKQLLLANLVTFKSTRSYRKSREDSEFEEISKLIPDEMSLIKFLWKYIFLTKQIKLVECDRFGKKMNLERILKGFFGTL